nr:PQQ-binding-like beta-propeller repeat protein [uncultured Actinoplanes sp.]
MVRSVLRIGFMAAVCLVLGGPPAVAATPGWDHPGYDAEDSYYNPHESAINAGSVGSLRTRWSVSLRRFGETCGGWSAPLAAAGRAVVGDQLGVSAYSLTDGKPAWHFTWPDPGDTSVATMAVSGGTLVAAHGECYSQSDPDGHLVALDLATGKLRWKLDTDTPVDSFVVDKGIVLTSGSSPSDELVTVAYRVADGKPAWTKPLHDASPVSADGHVLLVKDRTTSAADITTGRLLWTKPAIWHAESATPAADRFLVTNGAALSAINASTGAVTWTVEGKQSPLLATDGRRAYVASGRSVEALDMRTGRRFWSRRLGEEGLQPVRAGGLVYTGGPILNAASGAIVSSPPALAAAKVAVTGGRLLAVKGPALATFTP